MPMVTVIVPVYKAEKFLSKCLESIINQSYKDIEIILVNDGSPDKSLEIAQEFVVKDKRIKIINKENEGVSVARNIALDIARGEYICFVDSDDYVELDMIAEMYKKIEDYDADLILSDYNRVFPDRIKEEMMIIDEGFYSDKRLLIEFFEDYISLTDKFGTNQFACTKLFKKEIIDKYKIRFNRNLKIGEDHLFTAQYISHIKSFYALTGRRFYNYVYQTQSTMVAYRDDLYDNIKLFFLELHKINYDGLKRNDLDKKIYSGFILHLYRVLLNENKPENKKNKRAKIERIYSIISDDYCQRALSSMNKNYVPKKLKPYYVLSKRKMASLVYLGLKAEYKIFSR